MHDVFNGKWFVQVKPLDGLTLTGTMGYYLSHRQYDFFSNDKYGQSSTYHGSVRQSASRNSSVNLQGLANNKCSFADKHNMDFLLGYEQYSLNMSGIWGSGRNVYSGFNHTLSNIIDNKELGGEKDYYATRGIFGRVNYNYDNRYFGSVSYRRDASSRFARDHRWGNFWSLSAAWDISNEEFFEPLSPVVDFLKYKISFGQQGNDQMAQGGVINNYPYIDQYNQGGANGVWSVGTLFFKGNPNLTWETSNSFNTGFDFSLWHGMLSGSLEYFMRQTDDMLFFKPTGLSSGYSSIPMNIGSMRNSGIEFNILWRDMAGEFTYSVGANISTVRNKVLRLGTTDLYDAGSSRTEVGRSISDFFLIPMDGIFQSKDEVYAHTTTLKNGNVVVVQPTAEAGDIRYVDTNGDGQITQDDRVYAGSPLPKFEAGLTASLEWRGIDFSMFWTSRYGNKVYNSTRAGILATYVNSMPADYKPWTWDNPSNEDPRMYANASNNTMANTDRFLEDGSFLRLKNLQLGYSIPTNISKRFGVQRLRMYVSGQNLWTITGYKGYDPELISTNVFSQGYDSGQFPNTRQYNVGLQVTF